MEKNMFDQCVSIVTRRLCLQFGAVCHGIICCDGGLEMASYFLLRILAALHLENHTVLDSM